jgi:DNA-binding response OmpR family regulator
MLQANFSILLIEDDLSLGQTVVDLFKSKDHLVKWCKSGQEALNFLEDTMPDVIVCDLMMPGMSGEDFFLRIRKISKFNKVPFIIITANVAFDMKIRQLEIGVNDYMTKPFKFNELLLKVKNIIEFKQKLEASTEKFIPNLNDKLLKKNFFKSLNAILERNITTNLDIDHIAAELYVSKSTLFKRIKASKNCSTSQYIREFKIQYAIRLIEEGETNVQFLADNLGFNSLSYFSICFKKYTKVSPRKYIKSITNSTS